MKKLATVSAAAAILAAACAPSGSGTPESNLTPLDSILLSDPAILADSTTMTYYMTGTGGQMWKSKDLAMWEGPFDVVEIDSTSWMGAHPHIWAAELHKYRDRYYYFATFTNDDIKIDTVAGVVIPRRASHILVADTPDGPYRPAGTADYLPASRPTLDGTFWTEPDGTPYMVFCGEWLQNQNGTVESLPLTASLDAPAGEPEVLFRASDSPWSRELRDNTETWNRVTDGPWLFRTGTGRLGMLWTSWIHNIYTMGVAYSESGTLAGPWIQQQSPVTGPDYGHGMIFTDFKGRTVLSAHTHTEVDGQYIRRPHFYEADITGDSLRIIGDLKLD